MQVTLDIVGLTLLLYFSGGVENPFFPFYVFPVILAARCWVARAGYGYSALAIALYTGMLIAEATMVLPHHHLVGLHPPRGPSTRRCSSRNPFRCWRPACWPPPSPP